MKAPVTAVLGAVLACPGACSPDSDSTAIRRHQEEFHQRVQRLDEQLSASGAPAPPSNDAAEPPLPDGFETFIIGVWRHSGSNDAGVWAGDFAEYTAYAYAPDGRATRGFITADRQKLIFKYPTRRYRKLTVSDIEVINPDTVRAVMNFSYEYTGTKRTAGQAKTTLTCERLDGVWQITGFRETTGSQPK